MDYAEFEVEYQRVSQLIISGPGDQDLSADIAHLHELVTRIDDEDDRENAHFEVLGLEDALSHGPGDAPSEITLQARRVFTEANRNDGTVAERLARAEEGVRALSRMSGTREEEQAIGALSHTLDMLIGALRSRPR